MSDVTGKVRGFINGWNDRKHPFVWTKIAGEVLNKINRKLTSMTSH